MQSKFGSTMGPPADIEYAVDPVDVESMMPSARYLILFVPDDVMSISKIFV